MNRENNLIDCLFSVVDSFNTALGRLDALADKQEEIIKINNAVFTKMREEFFKKVIEFEVNKEIEKNRKNKERSVKFGSDIVREAKSS